MSNGKLISKINAGVLFILLQFERIGVVSNNISKSKILQNN